MLPMELGTVHRIIFKQQEPQLVTRVIHGIFGVRFEMERFNDSMPCYSLLTLLQLVCSESEQKPCRKKGNMASRYQFDAHLTGIGLNGTLF